MLRMMNPSAGSGQAVAPEVRRGSGAVDRKVKVVRLLTSAATRGRKKISASWTRPPLAGRPDNRLSGRLEEHEPYSETMR